MSHGSHVDIGFPENCESWRLESPQFPSKIGGKPAWLSYKNLPTAQDLQCVKCSNPTTFLCQVYAPIEECDNNFHRTLFIFACRNASCNTKNDSSSFLVFRDNLPRSNDFYSFNPPPEDAPIPFEATKWQKLCELCGCAAEKSCAKCQTPYCSRQHQVLDWKETHKTTCGKEGEGSVASDTGTNKKKSQHLLKEFELVIEPEELAAKKEVDVEEQLRVCGELRQRQAAADGELADVEESELDRHAAVDGDRTFTRFRKRVDDNPEQVLRYERGGEPLWIAASPTPGEIPNCQQCGARRLFEFQIMPQLLAAVEELELDFGVLLVYSCEKSCWGGLGYRREFIFKQDVAD